MTVDEAGQAMRLLIFERVARRKPHLNELPALMNWAWHRATRGQTIDDPENFSQDVLLYALADALAESGDVVGLSTEVIAEAADSDLALQAVYDTAKEMGQ